MAEKMKIVNLGISSFYDALVKHTNLTNSHFLPIHRILQYYFLSLNNELKPLNDNVL